MKILKILKKHQKTSKKKKKFQRNINYDILGLIKLIKQVTIQSNYKEFYDYDPILLNNATIFKYWKYNALNKEKFKASDINFYKNKEKYQLKHQLYQQLSKEKVSLTTTYYD